MFGSDGSPILQYVVIFAVIFTALAAIVFLVRRLTGRGLALPGRAGARGRQPRLGIVDVYELDRARQLILLRRDNVEHLLLVGGPNDVVIERNIQRGQRALPEAGLRPDALAEPLPDPLAGAGRLPEPPLALPEIAGSEIGDSEVGGRRSGPPFDPGFAMPVVVPAPVPRSGAAPPVTLPLDAVLLGGDEPGQDIAVPPRRTGPGARFPAPPTQTDARTAGPGTADVATTLARPPVQPATPARESLSARFLRRTAPPALDPRPEPASERRPEAASVADAAPADEAVPPHASAPVPPLAVPAERRAVDPAILSDMARQLQAALARPASAVTPAPPQGPSPAPPVVPGIPVYAIPEPVPSQASSGAPAVDTMAAAMAAPASDQGAAPPRPVPPRPESPAGPIVPRDPAAQDPAPSRPVPPSPAPPSPAPTPPLPVPSLQRRGTAPSPAPEAVRPPVPTPPSAPEIPAAVQAAAEPAAKSAGNPFSVEEIEAEFARLLGRPLDKRG